MSNFYAGMLMFVLNRVLTPQFMDHVIRLVKDYTIIDIDGDAKKAAVKADLEALTGDAHDIYNKTADYIINLAVEVGLTWVRNKSAVVTDNSSPVIDTSKVG